MCHTLWVKKELDRSRLSSWGLLGIETPDRNGRVSVCQKGVARGSHTTLACVDLTDCLTFTGVSSSSTYGVGLDKLMQFMTGAFDVGDGAGCS